MILGFGAIEPPSFVVDAVQQTVSDPQTQAWLNAKGREAASTLIKLPLLAIAPPSPPNPWVDKIVSPVLSPFAGGVRDEAIEMLLPVALALGGVAIGIGYLMGRRA